MEGSTSVKKKALVRNDTKNITKLGDQNKIEYKKN